MFYHEYMGLPSFEGFPKQIDFIILALSTFIDFGQLAGKGLLE